MRRLTPLLQWLTTLLILRVLVSILANYPDYFPPNFDSLFLQGRESTFVGIYRPAFYIHIFAGPVVLLGGLILMSETIRQHYGQFHRILGRVHVCVLLLLVLPTSVVMSRHAFGGPWAGLSFLLLSLTTALCAIIGVAHARSHRYEHHRRWMIRCYVLICSAVILRLLSGTAELIEVQHAERAYIIASWCSWLIPLAATEVIERYWPRRVPGGGLV